MRFLVGSETLLSVRTSGHRYRQEGLVIGLRDVSVYCVRNVVLPTRRTGIRNSITISNTRQLKGAVCHSFRRAHEDPLMVQNVGLSELTRLRSENFNLGTRGHVTSTASIKKCQWKLPSTSRITSFYITLQAAACNCLVTLMTSAQSIGYSRSSSFWASLPSPPSRDMPQLQSSMLNTIDVWYVRETLDLR